MQYAPTSEAQMMIRNASIGLPSKFPALSKTTKLESASGTAM